MTWIDTLAKPHSAVSASSVSQAWDGKISQARTNATLELKKFLGAKLGCDHKLRI